jgi:hypothetical protein
MLTIFLQYLRTKNTYYNTVLSDNIKDRNGVSRGRESKKDRQCNDQRTDNELGKTRQKTNYLATQWSKGSMNKGHSVLYLISIWSCVEI